MRKFLLGALLSTALCVPAHANIVLYGGSIGTSIYQDSGEGFGALPRVLTLQDSPTEHGWVVPGPAGTTLTPDRTSPTVINQAIDGSNKANTPTLFANGWGTGADVGIGFNANEPGSTSTGGISLSQLVLTIYNTSNVAVKTYSLASTISWTEAQLSLEGGNGKGLWRFVLDDAQKADYTAFVAANLGNGVLNYRSGLEATLGNPLESSAGAESFLFYHSNADGSVCIGCAPTPTDVGAVPEPTTWAMMFLGFAGIGLYGMRRRRNERLLRLA
jgi:hypothetical protein